MTVVYPRLNQTGKLLGFLHKLKVLEVICNTVPAGVHANSKGIEVGSNAYFTLFMWTRSLRK